MEDEVFEELERKEALYQTEVAEKQERKPVKMVTQVNAISKEELEMQKLKEEEMFKDAE